MRMQKLMGLFAERFFQEFLVKFLDVRIQMGFPEFLAFIFMIKRADPGIPDFIIRLSGLSAAADAAAGAAHDFNEMPSVFISGGYKFAGLFCV